MDRTPLVLIRLARIWVGGNRWTILGPCQTLALVHTAATTFPAQGGQFSTTGGAETQSMIYIVPTNIQKRVKLKSIEPLQNNGLAVYSILV